ncbi:MAG TPA: RdgB/HAM1 family non-canonical purine NTP pyrophosphatase [Acidimicrobiia bacterium]|nr:RdgB/HAM1 family non-canonical purine NTP pyrophosphatase [Acidimicrobiia bacterium]
MSRFLLATHNPDKVKEIESIFRDALGDDIEFVVGIDPGDVEEDGDTIEENSMIKATAWLEVNPDCVVLSDDTGFFVEALDGAPGIYAARYAGENATYADNCNKVMRELGESTNRRAHFSTCATAVSSDSPSIVSIGSIEGLVVKEARGLDGFGYDPIFIPSDDEDGETFAQMGINVKNMISHRARAFRALAMGIKDAGW